MKRRDFLKGVAGCVGVACCDCYGSLIGCPENNLSAAQNHKKTGDHALEIIVKKTFSTEAGMMRIGLMNGRGEFLFLSHHISPQELTEGKEFRFPLPPLPVKGSVQVVYQFYSQQPKHGAIEANIIYN